MRALSAAAISAVLLAGVPAAVAGQDRPWAHDSTAVSSAQIDSVVDAFHAALERGDSTAVLAMLDPEVTIYEAGHAETFEQYRRDHLAADIEFAQSVDARRVDGWAWFGAHHALAGRTYAARGTFRGREIDAVTTETIFLQRTREGAWRIRHIHWSSRRAEPSGR